MNKTENDFIDHLKKELKNKLITENYFNKVIEKVEDAYNERQKMETKLLNLRNEYVEKLRNKNKK
jgi:flagellar biosynthesis chaperone FliJ